MPAGPGSGVRRENEGSDSLLLFLSARTSNHKNSTLGLRPPAPARWRGVLGGGGSLCASVRAPGGRRALPERGEAARTPRGRPAAGARRARRPRTSAGRRGRARSARGGRTRAAPGRRVTRNERGQETRRARGKRAPSACCRGAAGARRGGDLLTARILLTWGSRRPESAGARHRPGTSRLAPEALTGDLRPPPFATSQPFQFGVRKWRRLLPLQVQGPTRWQVGEGAQFCRLLDPTPGGVGGAPGTHLLLCLGRTGAPETSSCPACCCLTSPLGYLLVFRTIFLSSSVAKTKMRNLFFFFLTPGLF